MAAEGRPSSLQEEGPHEGVIRRRRSPNLGIATLALDALGNTLGIEALGSSISPAEAALVLFATRKTLIWTLSISSHESMNLLSVKYHNMFQLSLYPQTPFTNR